MQVAHKTINAIGLDEIHAFLAAYHKLGGDHFTPSMLSAWAAEAEESFDNGNGMCFEIKSWDSATGRTEEFTVSDAGIDMI